MQNRNQKQASGDMQHMEVKRPRVSPGVRGHHVLRTLGTWIIERNGFCAKIQKQCGKNG